MKILLTHTPFFRTNYYGERSLSGLQALGEVILHQGDAALEPAQLIAAARGVDIIVADRMTTGPGQIFEALPDLRAFVRCAVEIRHVDVPAATAAGIVVTRAGPGVVAWVLELTLG